MCHASTNRPLGEINLDHWMMTQPSCPESTGPPEGSRRPYESTRRQTRCSKPRLSTVEMLSVVQSILDNKYGMSRSMGTSQASSRKSQQLTKVTRALNIPRPRTSLVTTTARQAPADNPKSPPPPLSVPETNDARRNYQGASVDVVMENHTEILTSALRPTHKRVDVLRKIDEQG